jgi:hypothetical protein
MEEFFRERGLHGSTGSIITMIAGPPDEPLASSNSRRVVS